MGAAVIGRGRDRAEVKMILVLVPLLLVLCAQTVHTNFASDTTTQRPPSAAYGAPVDVAKYLPPRPVYESGGSYRVEYLHVNFMPTPPILTTTKKPEGGLFRKIFHKKAKKFQNVKNVASGFLSTFHL